MYVFKDLLCAQLIARPRDQTRHHDTIQPFDAFLVGFGVDEREKIGNHTSKTNNGIQFQQPYQT